MWYNYVNDTGLPTSICVLLLIAQSSLKTLVLNTGIIYQQNSKINTYLEIL